MVKPVNELNLWKKQLGAIPESVWEAIDVETLILADNGLETVSADIARLKSLRTLDLGHNRIASIPDALGDLVSLDRFLYLHDNRLTELPASLARLSRLRYLNISENAFVAWPEVVSGMVCLLYTSPSPRD